MTAHSRDRARCTTLLAAVGLMIVCPAAVPTPASAADAPPAAPELVAIKGAHLFDGTGSALKNGGVIVVRGDKIVSVGDSVPADARVIDLGNVTLLPGFIDSHTHLTSQFKKDYYKEEYEQLKRTEAEDALQAAVYARRTLEAGFTTVRNLGARDYIDVGLRNSINSGVTAGPRMITAVHGIGSPGGHFDQTSFRPDRIHPLGPMQGICSGPEQCREAVRDQMKFGADVIKIAASGGVLSETDPVDVPQLTPEEMTAIMSEAHKWGRKVAAHSHGDLAARMAIAAGVDSIEHGSFLSEDTLKLMKAKGVYLVPTRMAVYWVNKQADTYPPQIGAKARAAWTAANKSFKDALRIGTPIAFGTDAGVYPHGMNAHEFFLMTEEGMSPSAALLAGTREAAKLLGVSAEVGTLEAGKTADIVAVPGDALSDITATEHPVFVMHLGKVVVQKAAN